MLMIFLLLCLLLLFLYRRVSMPTTRCGPRGPDGLLGACCFVWPGLRLHLHALWRYCFCCFHRALRFAAVTRFDCVRFGQRVALVGLLAVTRGTVRFALCSREDEDAPGIGTGTGTRGAPSSRSHPRRSRCRRCCCIHWTAGAGRCSARAATTRCLRRHAVTPSRRYTVTPSHRHTVVAAPFCPSYFDVNPHALLDVRGDAGRTAHGTS